jgi:hypothetical protein
VDNTCSAFRDVMTFNIINFSIAEFHLPPQYKPLLFFNPDMSVKKLNKKRRES